VTSTGRYEIRIRAVVTVRRHGDGALVYSRSYDVSRSTGEFYESPFLMMISAVNRFVEAVLDDLNSGNFDDPPYSSIQTEVKKVMM
jgi:hypothetical protein